jgi:hypothetical protein
MIHLVVEIDMLRLIRLIVSAEAKAELDALPRDKR